MNFPPNPIGNLDGFIPTAMDIKLFEVFDGECTRDNDGAHLDGDIPDYSILRERYKNIITFPISQHDIPSSPIGWSFVRFVSNKLRVVMDIKWNIEKPLYFVALSLQISHDVKGSSNARKRIKHKLLE